MDKFRHCNWIIWLEIEWPVLTKHGLFDLINGFPKFKTVQQFENTVEIQDINRIIALLNVHWFFFIHMSSRFKLTISKYINQSSCYIKTGLTKVGNFFTLVSIEIALFSPKGKKVKILLAFQKSAKFSLTSPSSQPREKSCHPDLPSVESPVKVSCFHIWHEILTKLNLMNNKWIIFPFYYVATKVS